MLARALRDVSKGFYIDVGAQDPTEYSVTKAFYDVGWRGINIEPSEQWFSKLEDERPHDLNLMVAASDVEGSLRFFNVDSTGLSTTVSDFAERHADAGFQVTEQIVPCDTLDRICEEAAVDVVHFLKVDCEGAELSVLRGLSLKKLRPWIVLVEATEPLSEKSSYEAWEPLLTGRGYHFVYDDGLNRFYVADEKASLDAAFLRPPNVFDDFIRSDILHLRRDLEHAKSAVVECDQWRSTAGYLQDENERREAALADLRKRFHDLEGRDSLDPNRLQQTIEYLTSENERRETALQELRTLLDEKRQRESAERERLEATVAYLQQENERREAALVEQRQSLTSVESALDAERKHLQATIEYLRQENERREAALVQHRQALETVGSNFGAERERLQTSVQYLRQENERREAALIELRQGIEASGARELAERQRLHDLIDHLRHENELREAALADHRLLLEQAGRRESGERSQLQATIEYLREENERREGALVHYRQLIENAGERERCERVQLQSTIDFLRQENERREAVLVDQGRALESARDELGDMDERLQVAAHELDSARSELRRKELESSTRQAEMTRVLVELAARSQEILRLDTELRSILGSTSWRITAPGRAVRRLSISAARFTKRAGYLMARGPARFMRPALRAIAMWPGVPEFAAGIVGRDSAIAHHTRLFLFGNGVPKEGAVGQTNASLDLGWQASRVRERMEILRRQAITRKGRG
ncbi:FkbM family methyltransferase [Novilysobacter arseniciresistens]|uniref:FkbM family methyltransferase n=1 Tax=Novilysobacter arseniciresistens TaxID=1385522 RepID=UPI000A75F048|nr:FkbM family methyltransferase [Lysobacter arseniciresistens]